MSRGKHHFCFYLHSHTNRINRLPRTKIILGTVVVHRKELGVNGLLKSHKREDGPFKKYL